MMATFTCPRCHANITPQARRVLEAQTCMVYELRVTCPNCHQVAKFKLIYSMVLTGAEPVREASHAD